MKTYRLNALMAGVLYFLGTAFGIGSAVLGGEVVASVVTGSPPDGDILALTAAQAGPITASAFLILLMGLSLAAMTIFLFPLFRKDSEVLATGMLLFRGALEGACYVISTLGFLSLVVLAKEYAATGAQSEALRSMGRVTHEMQSVMGPLSSIIFLTGASFLYVSFYRTRLIPRWLTLWGLVGVVPYMAYALLNFFGLDNGVGFYLQMVLAPQEMVMALWLVFKGFDPEAVRRLTLQAAPA